MVLWRYEDDYGRRSCYSKTCGCSTCSYAWSTFATASRSMTPPPAMPLEPAIPPAPAMPPPEDLVSPPPPPSPESDTASDAAVLDMGF